MDLMNVWLTLAAMVVEVVVWRELTGWATQAERKVIASPMISNTTPPTLAELTPTERPSSTS